MTEQAQNPAPGAHGGEAGALMADEWQQALGQLRRAMYAVAAAGSVGLLAMLAALLLAGPASVVLAVLGSLLIAAALGFVLWLHRQLDREATGAIDEYRVTLSLLASLQETSGAMGELLAAMRTTSVDGLMRLDRTVQPVE